MRIYSDKVQLSPILPSLNVGYHATFSVEPASGLVAGDLWLSPSLGTMRFCDLTGVAQSLVDERRIVVGIESLTGGGALSGDLALRLVGDTASPGVTKYYGTDGSGVRGWYPLAPVLTYDRLSTDVSTEVAITAATILSASALGKRHLISGTATDYSITLPTAVGVAGQKLSFRVDLFAAASKVYTIDPNGAETIDGKATLALIGTNAIELVSDGTNWSILSARLDTDWQDGGETTITAVTTAPTKPTVRTADKMRWRRVGDTVEARYEYRNASATGAAAGSGTYLWALPFAADTAKLPASVTTNNDFGESYLGHGSSSNNGSSTDDTMAFLYDSTHFRLTYSAGTLQGSAHRALNISGGISIGLRLAYPVAGW
jgi:hypothetical protein